MTTIALRLQAVKSSLQMFAPGRPVTLVAVSKAQPQARIREAFAAGQLAFGENYAQEALGKMAELADLPIEWHYIGPIQSNKTRLLAEHFDWVHSIERAKIADRLNDARPAEKAPLNVCIQVNAGGETSKQGAPVGEAETLARHVSELPRLKLRGLMSIPEPEPAVARQRFRDMKALIDRLNRSGLDLDTLSMGMSDDYPLAVAEGATMVRIGTAIFGPREHRAVANA